MSLEEIMMFLMKFPEDIDVDELYYNINQIKISHAKYEQMRQKFHMSNNMFFNSSRFSRKKNFADSISAFVSGNSNSNNNSPNNSNLSSQDLDNHASTTSSYGEKRINKKGKDDCTLS